MAMAEMPSAREAVRRRDARPCRLEEIKRFIGGNLHRADLTPAGTARAFAISLRQLHLLFAPGGTSFSRYLLGQRLERVRHLLVSDPGRNVRQLARACGIASSTVFYRAFRNAYGVTPTQLRDAARGEGVRRGPRKLARRAGLRKPEK